MVGTINALIFFLFRFLVFFIPIVLFRYTSELFEFNKIILLYILTLLITSSWILKMVLQRKILFRRTILDIPILLFVLSQIVSTVFSLDSRTSFLGYYSRFNGGLASVLSYCLLYWAWVANLDAKKTLSALKFLLVSAFLVAVLGILEHFGIDKDVWVQDVTERVFSTLGQPNWLAAWLVALTPLTWALALKAKNGFRDRKFWLFFGLSFVFFVTILFTKSRSGLLGLGLAGLIFWLFTYSKKLLRKFLLINITLAVIAVIVGTPWSPPLYKLILKRDISQYSLIGGTALEGGGTESGTIRRIVWQGAFEVWRHHPFIGTGVETFAYSFYNYRPIEHNLVSEWDFLYNKAHNEYLNIMANTGTLGIATYLLMVAFGLILIKRSKSQLSVAFLSGYASLLATNFFGFSVTPTSVLLALFPALAYTLSAKPIAAGPQPKKLDRKQKFLAAPVLVFSAVILFFILRYWYADILFAKGKSLNDSGRFVEGRAQLVKAVSASRHEAIFWDELSQASTGLALALWETEDKDLAGQFSDSAIKESQAASLLSPKNVNLLRNRASMYIRLTAIDNAYLAQALGTIMEAIVLAPTDAKLYYNLGLTYLRTGDKDKALETLERTIAMKPNYRDARLAYALVLVDKGQKQKAIEELTYILNRIEPNDQVAKDQLQELTNK